MHPRSPPPFDRLRLRLEHLRSSDTGKAGGLAGAMIVNNVLALISSVVFARLLSDYGNLAALISYLVILTVAGQAVQVATAREGVLGHLGTGEEMLATLERWARGLAVFTVAATVVSILLRQPIADAIGVPHQVWAAAVGIPAGCLYLGVSALRGALQGIGDYRTVGLSLIGEQSTRLIAGAILAAAGLGVSGAYLGSFISYIAMSAYCSLAIYRRLAGPGYPRWRLKHAASGVQGLGGLVWAAAIPISALAVIQVLQNIDLIIAKHQFSTPVASSYAVAAVAAKVLIWVAMGASFYLVPETSRRRSTGAETLPVLLKSLGIVAVCAVPCMLIFALGSHQLLAAVFGESKAIASSSLLPLGAAFTVLATTFLAVQYMLALKRVWFLPPLALVAAIEPVLLLQAPRNPASFATVVLFVQLIAAAVAYTAALWRRQKRPSCSSPGASGSNDSVEASEAAGALSSTGSGAAGTG